MYATYPVCAPARSSIISGMYPQSIGTHNMRAMHYDNFLANDRDLGERTEWDSSLPIPRYSSKIAESIKPFPMILRQNGYFTYNDAKGDYNFIINELSEIEPDLGDPEIGFGGPYYGRATKAALWMLRAKVKLNHVIY